MKNYSNNNKRMKKNNTFMKHQQKNQTNNKTLQCNIKLHKQKMHK